MPPEEPPPPYADDPGGLGELIFSRLSPAAQAAAVRSAAAWRTNSSGHNEQSECGTRVRPEPFLNGHVQRCQTCGDGGACPTFLALCHVLLDGHDPGDWSVSQEFPQRKLTKRQRARPPERHKVQPDHATFLREKADDWAKRGIIVSQPADDDTPSTPVFVVDKLSPRPGREDEFADWILQQPEADLRAWAEGKGFDACPPCAKLKRRPIFDLRLVNAGRTVKLRMRFRSTQHVCNSLRSGVQLAAVDFAEGYTSVPVSQGRHALVSAIGGRVWRHASLPFGYWAAPALFCLLSGEVAAQVRYLVLDPADHIQVYIDDTILVLSGGADAVDRKFSAAVAHMRSVGFTVHPEKLQRPSTEVEYLGVRLSVHAAGSLLTIPAHKAAGLRIMVQLANRHATWPSKFWDRLLGKLQAASPLIPGSGPHLGTLRSARYAARMVGSSSNSVESLGPAAQDSLRWLYEALCPVAPKLLRPWIQATLQGSGRAFTDASGEGGLGGVLLLRAGNEQPTARAFSVRTPESAAFAGNGNSTTLELLAILQVVQLACKLWADSHTSDPALFALHVTVDSKAAMALIQKGYSNRALAINSVLTALFDECRMHGVVLTVDWVSRNQNVVADALSHPSRERAERVETYICRGTPDVHSLPQLLATLPAFVYR